MLIKRVLGPGLGLLILLQGTLASPGQELTGTLQGTVFDTTGAVLPDTRVQATSATNGRTVSTDTGAYGDFSISNLAPGKYSLTFNLRGFSKTEIADVTVLASQTFRVGVTLQPGPVTTTVQITNSAAALDTQSATIRTHIPEQDFERLPKSRSFQYFALTVPGVHSGEIEGGIQIHGASGAENVYLVDGIPVQSAIDGRQRQNAAFEHLTEVQITTAAVDAEYAGGTGGIISAITQSGGSALRGNAWLYYTGGSLTAAPPPRLVLDPQDDRTVSVVQDLKNDSIGLEPGFSLGGPIRGNRMFFYTSWSPRWARQDQLNNFSSGNEPVVFRREQKIWSGFNKVSFEPSARVRGAANWLWSPSSSVGTLPFFNAACPSCVSSSGASNDTNATRGFFTPQSSYGASLDVVATKSLLLSFRGGYFWDDYKDTGVPDAASVTYQAPAVAPLVPVAFQGPVGLQNTPRILKAEHDRVGRATAYADAAFRRSPYGAHAFKAGFGFEKAVNDIRSLYPNGYVLVWWDRSITTPSNTTGARGPYGYYEVNDIRTIASGGVRNLSFYGQDRWNVADRLTLSFGVRFEKEQLPSFRPGAPEFGWTDLLTPRVGASFDALGDGRLKLYGSWGRYFDAMKLDLARNIVGGQTWRTYYRSLDSPDVGTLSLQNMPGQDLWNPAVTPFRDRSVALLHTDPELKPMSQDQWVAGADYQLNSRTILGARFLHQGLRRAIEDLAAAVGGNLVYAYGNPGEGRTTAAPFVTTLTTRPLPYPRPVRNYDAFELTAARTSSRGWFGTLSYTISRLRGNYSGPANSDEILPPVTGVTYAASQQSRGTIAHTARYSNYSWDLDQLLFDSRGHYDVRGPLATDRPHVLKWSGGYEWRLSNSKTIDIGTFFYLASGTPLTTRVNTNQSVPVFVNGRGDMGRTPALSTTDVQIAHRFIVAESQTVRAELSVLNVFNQKTARHRFDNLNRGAGVPAPSSAIDLSSSDLRAGYDYEALVQATPEGANAFDPRYGKEDLFNDGLAARLGIKWSF